MLNMGHRLLPVLKGLLSRPPAVSLGNLYTAPGSLPSPGVSEVPGGSRVVPELARWWSEDVRPSALRCSVLPSISLMFCLLVRCTS